MTAGGQFRYRWKTCNHFQRPSLNGFIFFSLLKKAKDNGVKCRCADMEQRLDVVLKMHDMQKRHVLYCGKVSEAAEQNLITPADSYNKLN